MENQHVSFPTSLFLQIKLHGPRNSQPSTYLTIYGSHRARWPPDVPLNDDIIDQVLYVLHGFQQ
jgi:hypothetical protein